jgi:MoxR-like ATPase
MARVLDLKFSRIQFTPDLMPSDITGTDLVQEDATTGVADGVRARADLRQHRARRRDQPHAAEDAVGAARGDAGASRHGAGQDLQLNEPFYVFATQNPIELEGTYPLPEAQLDRFMYPHHHRPSAVRRGARRRATTTALQDPKLERPVSGEDSDRVPALVRKVPVAEPVMRHALDIVRASRPKQPGRQGLHHEVGAFGASVRAAQYLVLGGKARALTSGRIT